MFHVLAKSEKSRQFSSSSLIIFFFYNKTFKNPFTPTNSLVTIQSFFSLSFTFFVLFCFSYARDKMKNIFLFLQPSSIFTIFLILFKNRLLQTLLILVACRKRVIQELRESALRHPSEGGLLGQISDYEIRARPMLSS